MQCNRRIKGKTARVIARRDTRSISYNLRRSRRVQRPLHPRGPDDDVAEMSEEKRSNGWAEDNLGGRNLLGQISRI